MTTKKQYLTKEGLEKFRKELDYLKTAKRKEIAERLKHAAAFGDLSENAAYTEAKEDQAFLEGRIRELGYIVRNAEIIIDVAKDVVQFGSTVEITSDFARQRRVRLRRKNPKSVEKFQLVGSAEANPLEGKISADSPLGKSLFNLKKGDVFYVNTPAGRIKHKVLKIS